MPTYTYYGDPVYRYRDENGHFVSQQTVWDWSRTSIDSSASDASTLAAPLATEQISLSTWQAEMRDRIKSEYVQQYLLGIGGRDKMTPAMWGEVGGIISEQYRWLDGFAAEIAAGNLSEAQIAARSAMYLYSAREAYERASSRARGIPTGMLPAYPGDGSSCLGLTNCKCNWRYVRKASGAWEAYWELGVADHCELCLQHHSEWYPVVIGQPE